MLPLTTLGAPVCGRSACPPWGEARWVTFTEVLALPTFQMYRDSNVWKRETLCCNLCWVHWVQYNLLLCHFTFSSIYHALARKYLKTPGEMDIKVRKEKLYWYSFGLYFILFLSAIATGQHSLLVSTLVCEIMHSRLKTVGELPRWWEDPKAERSGPTAWAQWFMNKIKVERLTAQRGRKGSNREEANDSERVA